MEKQTVKQLKAIARERGIKGYYRMKRAELLEVLGINESEKDVTQSKQPKKCPHDKQKYQCKECKGKGICHHNQRKSNCKDCKGSEICQHDRKRYDCKDRERQRDRELSVKIVEGHRSVLTTNKSQDVKSVTQRSDSIIKYS